MDFDHVRDRQEEELASTSWTCTKKKKAAHVSSYCKKNGQKTIPDGGGPEPYIGKSEEDIIQAQQHCANTIYHRIHNLSCQTMQTKNVGRPVSEMPPIVVPCLLGRMKEKRKMILFRPLGSTGEMVHTGLTQHTA